MNKTAIEERVRQILVRELGAVEEQLLSAGVIDSLRSVEIAISMEEEFQLPLGELTVSDLGTVTTLVNRIHDLARGSGATPR